MKIVLSPAEINRIVVDHLIEKGSLHYDDIPVDVTWRVNQFDVSKSEVIIEQEDYD